MPTFALSVHAGWRCRASLACCQAGWAIPVEPTVRGRIERGAATGALVLDEAAAGARSPASWLRRASGRRFLATDDGGHCVFLERRGTCGLQRALGEAAQPVACRQFPRVAVIEERGVSVSLTHFCPSAAGLLFDDAAPLAIRVDAMAFPPQRDYEGLDVRGVVAPWLRPGVWLDPEARTAFENGALQVLDRELAAEQALGALRAGVTAALRWRAGDGPLARHVERALAAGEADVAPYRPAHGLAALRAIEGCAPGRAQRPAALADDALAAADAALVAPAWAAFARPLRAWLAARLVASWVLWQGDGLAAVVRSLELGLCALRALAAQAAARAQCALDRERLVEALRATDLRLVQHADPRVLARLASRRSPFP